MITDTEALQVKVINSKIDDEDKSKYLEAIEIVEDLENELSDLEEATEEDLIEYE